MNIKLCTDRSLVASPRLRLRTRRHEYFLWWTWRPRFRRSPGDNFTSDPA